MAKGLGIAALVLLLLSVPIPFLGNYMTLLALLIAAVAALQGEVPLTVTTTLIAGIKLFMLSPSWHLAMFGAADMQAVQNTFVTPQSTDATAPNLGTGAANAMAGSNHVVLLVTLAFLAAPIAALLVRRAQLAKAGAATGETPASTDTTSS